MRLAGETQVAAPPDEVRGILTDPARLARHMPGVSGFAGDGTRWTLEQLLPLGLGELRLRWALERLGEGRLRGTGTGETLVVRVEAAFDVEPADGGSAVRWQADLWLGGSSSALARKVAGPVVRQQVDDLLRALGTEAGTPA